MKELAFMLVGAILATIVVKCKDRADSAEAELRSVKSQKEKAQ
jgi:hypothetical protein